MKNIDHINIAYKSVNKLSSPMKTNRFWFLLENKIQLYAVYESYTFEKGFRKAKNKEMGKDIEGKWK